VTRALARCDLTHTASLDREDEFGAMGEGLNRLVSTFRY
jgi:methyl-accepting chemotaxis protein